MSYLVVYISIATGRAQNNAAAPTAVVVSAPATVAYETIGIKRRVSNRVSQNNTFNFSKSTDRFKVLLNVPKDFKFLNW